MRTDVTTLNRHYADFYAHDPRTAWRELGALEKARSVALIVDRPVGRVVDIGCGEGSVIAILGAPGSPGSRSPGPRSMSLAAGSTTRRRVRPVRWAEDPER